MRFCSFEQISMAAVAGDADKITSRRARRVRTDCVNSPERANWVKKERNKKTDTPSE